MDSSASRRVLANFRTKYQFGVFGEKSLHPTHISPQSDQLATNERFGNGVSGYNPARDETVVSP